MQYQGPTLTVDKNQCQKNIMRMVEKAKRHNLQFRPHFKAHQSAEVGQWFREAGVTKITVSSVSMAEYFVEHGWNDITISFPIATYEIDRINDLAQKAKIAIVVSRKDIVKEVVNLVNHPISVFIEIDTGHNRTGIDETEDQKICSLIKNITKKSDILSFVGFLAHSGHSYHSKTRHGIYSVHFDSMLKLKRLKKRYISQYPDLKISIGDTPTAVVCEDYREIDEFRPGSFVFFDVKQWKLGVCEENDISLRMMCPVIAKHKLKNEIVIHGGANHFSLNSITNVDGKQLYGRVFRHDKDGNRFLLNEMNYVHHLSQEHGMVKLSPAEFFKFKVGDYIEVLPVDSNMALYTMGWMLDKEGKVIETMPRW